jgi:hypothetical protein
MPKVPIDYSKTQIYKWVCNDSSILCEYVGHTTNWDKRKASHKERCNQIDGKKYHLKLYETMRENGGFDNWKMILIEDYPCTGKREAEKREQYYIDLLVEKINTINSFTMEINKSQPNYNNELYKAHLKRHPNYHKENYQKNKEKNSERKKIKYTCECGVIICKDGKARHERSQKHILNMAVLTDQSAKIENK